MFFSAAWWKFLFSFKVISFSTGCVIWYFKKYVAVLELYIFDLLFCSQLHFSDDRFCQYFCFLIFRIEHPVLPMEGKNLIMQKKCNFYKLKEEMPKTKIKLCCCEYHFTKSIFQKQIPTKSESFSGLQFCCKLFWILILVSSSYSSDSN